MNDIFNSDLPFLFENKYSFYYDLIFNVTFLLETIIYYSNYNKNSVLKSIVCEVYEGYKLRFYRVELLPFGVD